MSADDQKRAAFIAALRNLADAMERNEVIPLPFNPHLSFINLGTAETPEGLAGIVRELGGTSWRQKISDSSGYTWLHVKGDLGGGLEATVQARADAVTQAVQTGVAPVFERKNPALDAVIAEAQEGGER
jgi:hypothetical protein